VGEVAEVGELAELAERAEVAEVGAQIRRRSERWGRWVVELYTLGTVSNKTIYSTVNIQWPKSTTLFFQIQFIIHIFHEQLIHSRRTTINLEKMSASDTQPHLGDPLTDVSSYIYYA
jgi:hypothetical protein